MKSAPDRLARAEGHLRAGRLADAISAYVQALAEDPDHPDAWFNLAWTQRADRRFHDALASYAEAIARGVARPQDARLNRAVILSDHLFDVGQAKIELRAALSLDPDFLVAWLNLANLHEDLGEIAEAEAAYAQALAIDPANARAHARLGAIATFRGEAGQAVPALRRALETARTADDRAEILFALGAALDDLAEHADAFQAIEAANWFARSIAPVHYDPAQQERLVDRLIATFPAPPVALTPHDDAGSVFICGMFRSGSTLAERMLSRHPAITAGGELEFIPDLARRLSPYPEAVPRLLPAEVEDLRARYLRERPAGTIVTDKRCDNFLHLGLIFTLFPGARIIHTVRQPLDTIVSLYFQHFGNEITYSHDLRDAAHYYIQYRRLMAHWAKLFGARIHPLDYDRLVADPEATLADAFASIGLQTAERLSGAPADDTVRTASVWQVRKPLHLRSSGRWRHYAAHLAEVRAMLAAAGL